MDNRIVGTEGGTAPPRNIRNGSGRGKRAGTVALSVFGVCLLIFSIGFFVGRSGLTAARSELKKNKSEAAAQVAQAKSETQQAKTSFSGAQAVIRASAARAWLYRSAVQLDRRNFGSAQADLKQAVTLLENGTLEKAGFSSAQAEEVTKAVKDISLTVSPDSEAQRAQILRAAEQMDGVFDAAPAAETP